jgi:hypothetical protein
LQNGTHVPSFVLGSTFQHIENASQSSMPDVGEPSTVHGSPGPTGSGTNGEHFVEFQASPPPSAYGMHFSPRWHGMPVHRSHSGEETSPGSMKVLSGPLEVDDVEIVPAVVESAPLVESTPVELLVTVVLAELVPSVPLGRSSSSSPI